jgi:Tfp pilus assembly protein PilF
LGVTALFSADIPATIPYYREAIAMMPNFALAWTNLADSEGGLGHGEAQLDAAQNSVRLFSDGNSDTSARAGAMMLTLQRGAAALYVGDYGQAAREFAAAAQLPDYGDGVESARENVALALALQHDAKGAHAAWEAMPVTTDPQDLGGRAWGRAYIDFALGDWQSVLAQRAWSQAGLDSTQFRHQARQLLWPYIAIAMAKTGDFAGAKSLIERTPLDCDICVRARGIIAASAHDWSDAGRWFQMESARTRHIPFADSEWGSMLLQKGDYAGAILKFEQANKKGPHFADPLAKWGEALMAENRSDLALPKFAEAARYAPNWGRLHLEWGKALFYAGQKDGAKKEFAIASRLDLSKDDQAALAKWLQK